jgi:hypothetical protein
VLKVPSVLCATAEYVAALPTWLVVHFRFQASVDLSKQVYLGFRGFRIPDQCTTIATLVDLDKLALHVLLFLSALQEHCFLEEEPDSPSIEPSLSDGCGYSANLLKKILALQQFNR